jgi:hypothetical protein
MIRRKFVPGAKRRPGRKPGNFHSIVFVLSLFLNGCALRPAWQTLATEQQLQTNWLDTGSFRHLVLEKDGAGQLLRIFVDGDGTPWVRQSRISRDPTPSNPVLLRLMQDAPGPAVYLGRPCYYGTATSKGCEARLWTFDRYGQDVVDSMCAAATELARRFAAETVQLIGYSGGGTLVVAMAVCAVNVVAITTIAANLDPTAWADYHDYSPLHDLRPLEKSVANQMRVAEVHWQCAHDANVPPETTSAYFAAVAGAARRVVENCTHGSGWERYWPEIMMPPVASE